MKCTQSCNSRVTVYYAIAAKRHGIAQLRGYHKYTTPLAGRNAFPKNLRNIDPVIRTASVTAIVQTTVEVTKYLSDVKDAPKECQRCVIVTTNLQIILIPFRYCLEQGKYSGDSWFEGSRCLANPMDISINVARP